MQADVFPVGIRSLPTQWLAKSMLVILEISFFTILPVFFMLNTQNADVCMFAFKEGMSSENEIKIKHIKIEFPTEFAAFSFKSPMSLVLFQPMMNHKSGLFISRYPEWTYVNPCYVYLFPLGPF